MGFCSRIQARPATLRSRVPLAISILNQEVLHLLDQVVIKIRPENRIKKNISNKHMKGTPKMDGL